MLSRTYKINIQSTNLNQEPDPTVIINVAPYSPTFVIRTVFNQSEIRK